jgi:hypothetical protein
MKLEIEDKIEDWIEEMLETAVRACMYSTNCKGDELVSVL